MSSRDLSAPERAATERWFRHQGLPMFIEDYSVTEDILTRVFPFMGLVVFVDLFQTFGDRWTGWAQAVAFIAGLALVVAVFALTNRLRRRPLLSLPVNVGWPEVGLYLLLPALPAAIGADDHSAATVLAAVGTTVAINLVLLAVAFLVVRWGLFSMARWAFSQVAAQLLGISTLALKALPLILLFSAFVFLNAEMWQVANDMTAVAFAGVTLLVVGLGSAFVLSSVRRISAALGEFDDWGEVHRLCAGTPMEHCCPATGTPVVALSGRERANATLRLFVALATQILLVSAVTAAFYVLFGMLTVRESTLLQWTTAGQLETARDWLWRVRVGGSEYLFSRQLLVVAVFIGLVSGLQFTVQVITDREFRAEFAAGMTADLQRALAVRTAYRQLH